MLTISRDVEKSVLALMGGTTAEYKSKIRSLFVNLKDKGNPGLRASIVDGSLAPKEFVNMTSQVGIPVCVFLNIMHSHFGFLSIANGFRRETSRN